MKESVQKRMKNNDNKYLIIIGHPEKESFCYNGIFKTIIDEMEKNNATYQIIDLCQDKENPDRQDLIKRYQDLMLWSTHLYFISPVWWFRLVPEMESFFDEVFTPNFAYKFISITKLYGYPKPLFKDKKVRTYVTHGAPALPVKTIYFNSVKLRLVLGVYSFVFGWKPSLWLKTKQFWSVPFISEEKRKKYLQTVRKHTKNDLGL